MIVSKSFRGSLVIFLISMLTLTIGSVVDGVIVSICYRQLCHLHSSMH